MAATVGDLWHRADVFQRQCRLATTQDLDFTPATFPLLDRYLRFVASKDDGPDKGQLILNGGCYWGEVITLCVGGSWQPGPTLGTSKVAHIGFRDLTTDPFASIEAATGPGAIPVDSGGTAVGGAFDALLQEVGVPPQKRALGRAVAVAEPWTVEEDPELPPRTFPFTVPTMQAMLRFDEPLQDYRIREGNPSHIRATTDSGRSVRRVLYSVPSLEGRETLVTFTARLARLALQQTPTTPPPPQLELLLQVNDHPHLVDRLSPVRLLPPQRFERVGLWRWYDRRGTLLRQVPTPRTS